MERILLLGGSGILGSEVLSQLQSENFDYVAPMVYPSHYANGFIGFANPADHPYEVVNYSMSSAEAKEKFFEKQRQKDLDVV